MKKLIINADDFGLTKKVSDAIIEVYKAGNLSSTTLMINMPGTDYAIRLAKENPALGIGLHFNITEGKSMMGVSTVTDKNGEFLGKIPLNKKVTLGNVNLNDIEAELNAQYHYLEKAGIAITHIDSHQHIHMHPKVFPLMADFAKSKGVNIRIAFPQVIKRPGGTLNLKKRLKQLVLAHAAKKNRKYADKIDLKYNQSFNSIFDFHPFQMPVADDYHQLIKLAKSDVHELMIHPYLLSDELAEIYGDKNAAKQEFYSKGVAEYEVLKHSLWNRELTTFSAL